MKCAKCGSYELWVTNTVRDQYNDVIRRRKCKDCGAPIITIETVTDYKSIYEATGDYSRKIRETQPNHNIEEWFKGVISQLEEAEKNLPKEEQ